VVETRGVDVTLGVRTSGNRRGWRGKEQPAARKDNGLETGERKNLKGWRLDSMKSS
jgi:hypothetical protein